MLFSQKIVAFDKRGKVKRIKYFEGEYIKLKEHNGEKTEGIILLIKDSSFVVEGKQINLDSVKKVYNTQKFLGFKMLYQVSIRAGVIYFPLVTFNRLINQDDPVLSEPAATVSGIFIGTALISKLIYNRGYKISDNRPLKIIDISL